jgi:hypothetical protein
VLGVVEDVEEDESGILVTSFFSCTQANKINIENEHIKKTISFFIFIPYFN